MLLGVVSDTHGNVSTTLAAVKKLESLAPEAVLHCGDIGSAEIPPLFAPWPTHFVFGNCDSASVVRPGIQAPQHTCWERFGRIKLGGRRIALLHSDDAQTFLEVSHSGEYDLVCYGHTHMKKEERIGNTLILNPGALHRAAPKTFALVELADLSVTFVPIE